MRLSAILCRRTHGFRDKLPFLRKIYWRDQYSNLTVDRLRVPRNVLKEISNSCTLEAEDMFSSSQYDDELAREIELGIAPEEAAELEAERKRRLAPWSPRAGDPRWHSNGQTTLMYHDQRRFSHDLPQACLLTNTALFSGIPESLKPLDAAVNNLFNSTKLEELRPHIERAILHAHVWHTDETKLPRRFCPQLPIWKHKAEFGIHPQRITRYLFQNLFHILELQSSMFSSALGITCTTNPRWTSRDRFLETHYHWGNSGKRIAFALDHDLVVCGKEALEVFLPDSQKIEEISRDYKPPIERLGPMSPLIDLQSTDYFRDDICDGWLRPKQFPHPHLFTINLSMPNVWSDYLQPESDPITSQQRQASALMHCFASTVAHAHRLGHTHGSLPVPICVQGVCSDGVYFDYIYYQLNTLSCPDPWTENQGFTGLRNLAWIDGPHRLFDKQVPKRSMLRNTKYRDLNMSVFARLMMNYLWGMHAISPMSEQSKINLASTG